MVTTICYGEKREWESRLDAISFFTEAMMYSEGSERDRYTNVYIDLVNGKDICTDEI